MEDSSAASLGSIDRILRIDKIMVLYQKTELLFKQAGSLNVRMSLYHDSVHSLCPTKTELPTLH